MQKQDSSDPTGVKDLSPKGNDVVARARSRKAHAAIQLRSEGHDWQQIAELIGYPTARAALVATERALEREMKTDEGQVFMRSMASRRLDALLRSVWDKATDPEHTEHLFAVDRAAKLIAQHAKLHGLDAPVEMIVTNPNLTEIENWVAQVVQKGSPELEEADIFDAEIVADMEDPDAVPHE